MKRVRDKEIRDKDRGRGPHPPTFLKESWTKNFVMGWLLD
jgi:hypothetical protein